MVFILRIQCLVYNMTGFRSVDALKALLPRLRQYKYLLQMFRLPLHVSGPKILQSCYISIPYCKFQTETFHFSVRGVVFYVIRFLVYYLLFLVVVIRLGEIGNLFYRGRVNCFSRLREEDVLGFTF